MRSLGELIDGADPALPLIRGWLAEAKRPHELLSPSDARGDVLVDLQVTLRSPMGAIAYETGGILVDRGWLRILGAGNPKLPRNLAEWNRGRPSGYLLVADDVVGGFFAVNGGSLGEDAGSMYYWAPDTLRWEALDIEMEQLGVRCGDGQRQRLLHLLSLPMGKRGVSRVEFSQTGERLRAICAQCRVGVEAQYTRNLTSSSSDIMSFGES